MGLRGEPHQQLEKDTGLHLRLTSSRNKGDDLAASVGARSEIAPEVQDESSDEIGRKAVHVVGDILLRHCDAQNPRDDCGTVRGDCSAEDQPSTGPACSGCPMLRKMAEICLKVEPFAMPVGVSMRALLKVPIATP
jgi:hypothetical protein